MGGVAGPTSSSVGGLGFRGDSKIMASRGRFERRFAGFVPNTSVCAEHRRSSLMACRVPNTKPPYAAPLKYRSSRNMLQRRLLDDSIDSCSVRSLRPCSDPLVVAHGCSAERCGEVCSVQKAPPQSRGKQRAARSIFCILFGSD